MYLSLEDARSDVILAAAATVFGGLLLELLLSAPGIPTRGTAAQVLLLLGWFALSGLAPLLLARYRQDTHAAFALGRDVRIGPALLLAVPLAAVGVGRALLVDGSPTVAVLGRVGRVVTGSPVVGEAALDLVGIILTVLQVAVLTVGSLLLVSFLTTRGAAAFRDDERSATELLRTFGLGAAGVALVAGVSLALTGVSLVPVLLNVAVLAVLVLVADRLTPAGVAITRPAVLTPAIVIAVAHLLAAGGLFRGGLFPGLYTGGLAAGTTVVIAVTVVHRRRMLAALPLVVAAHWWPLCFGPLPFSGC